MVKVVKHISPKELININNNKTKELVNLSLSNHSKLYLSFFDKIAKKFLQRSESPYLDEVNYASKILKINGLYAFNCLVEYACSSTFISYKNSTILVRALDWYIDIGKYTIVNQVQTKYGPYYSITWPGFVGIVQGCAPKRFAVALNMAPEKIYGLGKKIDNMIERTLTFSSKHLPTSHLLRLVLETCANYKTAVNMLLTTPTSTPALFIITGISSEEGCIIEKLNKKNLIHLKKNCITNHWINKQFKGRARPIDSKARLRVLQQISYNAPASFNWVKEPVLNDNTVLTLEMDARENIINLQSWSNKIPTSNIISLVDEKL